MSRILNNSIQDNKNILINLQKDIENNTMRALVSQSQNEIDEIENDLTAIKDDLKYMNDFNDATLKNELNFILRCIDLALIAVAIANNQLSI